MTSAGASDPEQLELAAAALERHAAGLEQDAREVGADVWWLLEEAEMSRFRAAELLAAAERIRSARRAAG